MKMKIEEQWKDVSVLDNLYEISSNGNLRRKSIEKEKENKSLKSFPDKDGYLKVCINLNGYKNLAIHRLVAIHFIPNPENKKEVNHKNGIKTDNRILNLEWCTRRENQIHAIKNKLQPIRKGSQRGKVCKLKETIVLEIKRRLANGEKYTVIYKDYGVSPTTIYDIFKNKTWTHVKI